MQPQQKQQYEQQYVMIEPPAVPDTSVPISIKTQPVETINVYQRAKPQRKSGKMALSLPLIALALGAAVGGVILWRRRAQASKAKGAQSKPSTPEAPTPPMTTDVPVHITPVNPPVQAAPTTQSTPLPTPAVSRVEPLQQTQPSTSAGSEATAQILPISGVTAENKQAGKQGGKQPGRKH